MVSVWVLSDGKAGTDNQSLGLAKELCFPFEIVRIKKKNLFRSLPSFIWTLPTGNLAFNSLKNKTKIKSSLSWPDLLIGSGKSTVGASIAIRRASKGKTYTVQLQNPRISNKFFDFVAPLIHDNIYGENVISTIGSLNQINEKTLKESKIKFPYLNNIPKPRIAILIGGNSKYHKLGIKEAIEICQKLLILQKKYDYSILISFSRRTPNNIKEIFKNRLNSKNLTMWDGEGKNPYYAFLYFADYIFITEDSISMISEAATTGKPIYILKTRGKSKKFDKFHLSLSEAGITRLFNGKIDHPWKYNKLQDTLNIAKKIKINLEIHLEKNNKHYKS